MAGRVADGIGVERARVAKTRPLSAHPSGPRRTKAKLRGAKSKALASADLYERGAHHTQKRLRYYDRNADSVAAAEYYSALEGSGSIDFASLSSLLKTTHTKELKYKEARRQHLYPRVDRHPDGKLRGIYTGTAFETYPRAQEAKHDVDFGHDHPTIRGSEKSLVDPMLTGFDAATQTLLFNTEHAVPQSWFDGRKPMKADLHILFTADPGCNEMRGSLPFGNSKQPIAQSCGVASSVFEPARNKGAVARAVLYFLVRHDGEISHRHLPPESLEVLLRWHKEDPPSIWEKHRNVEIARVQGNRNPFIDHPEWTQHIEFTAGLSD